MNTLADQVVELTVTLVRALSQTGQFDPAKPNFLRVRARLLKELVRLQRTQPEIGYLVGPPAVAGGPPEVWVDGSSPQRVELRKIVGPSIGGAFILQLLEILQQRGLVALGFARGIAEPEWNAFIEVVSSPPTEKVPANEGRRLARAFVEKKIAHISIVCEAELPASSSDQPWYVRTSFARLARDLRVAVSLGATTPAAVLEQSEQLTNAAAYSFFRKFDVLRQLLFHCSAVDELVRDVPALRSVRGLDVLVQGLPVLALHGTTRLIFKDLPASDEAPPESAATVLRAITERMLKMPSSRQVDETLRAMCRRKIVPITRLPVELQEWVLAENWVEAMRTEPAKEPPKGSGDSNPVRILQKGARYAFTQKLPVQATGILERIKSVAPKALPEVFDVPTVEAVIADFPENKEDRRALLALLEQGVDTAARSVAAVIVTAEPKLCEAAAWILTEMKTRGVAAALHVLSDDIELEQTARLLISCVSGKAPESAAEVFVRQLKHKAWRVRRDALTALAACSSHAAEVYVAQALSDPDENVRIRALLLCANTGVGSDKVVPRAIQLVAKDARGAPPQVVRAAIEVVVRRREAGALPIADAEAALCRLAAPIGFLGRLVGMKTPPAAVLVTAIVALGRLGTERSTKLLARLGRSKDLDIARAAGRELEHQDGRPPATLMPLADSTVFQIAKKNQSSG
jgi:HEAT repeat protein